MGVKGLKKNFILSQVQIFKYGVNYFSCIGFEASSTLKALVNTPVF